MDPPRRTREVSTPSSAALRAELLAAYAAAITRVASWAAVSALVFRVDIAAFALLALVRATLGLLNYTTVGLAPAMIRMLATARSGGAAAGGKDAPAGRPDDRDVSPRDPASLTDPQSSASDSRSPPASSGDSLAGAYSNGVFLALLCGAAGIALTIAYAWCFPVLHKLPPGGTPYALLVLGIGIGTVLRLMSDAPAAVLQTQGRIARDNRLMIAADAVWVAATAAGYAAFGGERIGDAVGGGFALSGAALLVLRMAAAGRLAGRLRPHWHLVSGPALRALLSYGAMVALAQLGSFLYAPTDYILINHLISPEAVALYAPAVQIDAALLLAVSALAAVLLPWTAVAHAAGQLQRVRRYYVRGTLASLGILCVAAAIVWVASPLLLRLWLGTDAPETRAILPLVLVHTVIGGSAGVGRAILLATGHVRTYTASVLVAGAMNVVLSYMFVAIFGMGLRGIIYGTIVTVVLRCAVWMPWYVMQTLRKNGALPHSET